MQMNDQAHYRIRLAEGFLGEVEGVVLETLLEKLFGLPRSGVSAMDAPTRFYVLWRYAYRAADIDAGEAIIFAYPQGVELDGPRSVSHGSRALMEKSKSKYRLRDSSECGEDDKLGLPSADGTPAPLIDVLHRALWLIENRITELGKFLDEARPDLDRLRMWRKRWPVTHWRATAKTAAEHLSQRVVQKRRRSAS